MSKDSITSSKNNLEKQTEDIAEYLELLKGLTEQEKAQVIGIMVGLQLAKV